MTEKEQFSMRIDHELVERARNASFSVPGLTLTRLTTEALRRYVATIERRYNGGEPFPERSEDLPRGRRVGAP